MQIDKYEELAKEIFFASLEVHKIMGPGLLENIYYKCMMQELKIRGINYKTELKIPLIFKGLKLESYLQCDMFIKDILVLEFKAVDKINPIEVSKLMSYMNQLESPLGLMINFNVSNIFSEGQKTYVNERYRKLEH